MSELVAYAGGTLLALATLPQARSILRSRDVRAFGWTFALLNFVGISFLAMRSWQIQEQAFLAINLVTAGFWLLVLALKTVTHDEPVPPGNAATVPPR